MIQLSTLLHYLILLLFLSGNFCLRQFVWAKQSPELAVNKAKYVKEITHIAILPENFKPSKVPSQQGRRLIFIGDVHGAYDELVELLAKAKYTSMTDHLIFLGDLVSKGPHSSEVVKLAMNLNASCVLGNHDYELLDRMGYINSVVDSRLDIFDSNDLPKELVLGVEEHSTAMGFDAQAACWMLECPLILKVGEIEGEELVAVHAGVLAGIDLKDQDPWTLMNMRNVYKGNPSRKTNEGEPWARLWNRNQQHIKIPMTIIYGHDARRGLQLTKHAKGIDTNCVRGGKLTALIYPGEEIIDVKCKEYYK